MYAQIQEMGVISGPSGPCPVLSVLGYSDSVDGHVALCSLSLVFCVMSLGYRGYNLPIVINSNNDSDCAGPFQVCR